MEPLFESPYLILTIGVLLIAGFGYLFLNTRQKGALIGLGVVVLLTLGCLAIEHFVETPREQVEASLQDLADQLEANNLEGALAYLDPENTVSRERARWALNLFRITKAKISNLEVTINEMTSPPSAQVKFTGMVGAASKKGADQFNQTVPVQFTAKLHQHGDRWIVVEHTDSVGLK